MHVRALLKGFAARKHYLVYVLLRNIKGVLKTLQSFSFLQDQTKEIISKFSQGLENVHLLLIKKLRMLTF